MFKSKNKANLRILAILIIVLTAFFLAGCMGSKASIGVVDMGKIMTESPKVKQLQEQLNAKGQELTAALEKDAGELSETAFQVRQEAAYGEFLKMKQEFETQIEAASKAAMEEVSKEKKLDIIVVKTSAPYGGIDVTEDVLKKMQ